MKVPINWLREYVDITLPPVDIAEKLTLAGIEAKGIQPIGSNWDNIFIGQLVAVDPHPDADRLRLVTVDLGIGRQTVVCGASNLNPGNKIAFARVGAQLIDGHSGKASVLTPARIRGIVSEGMVCSEKELGISDNHEGVLVLTPEAPIGTPLSDFLGDTVLDLDVTPNRPDCLSVIGIAREVAALTSQNPHIPEISYEETASPIEQQISIEITDPDLCARYCASLVTGIKLGESPAWIQERLLTCGMRPINNIVDITNYVMLEYGQPLHAFDYEKIRGKKIIVRRATGDEKTVTLDGTERVLSSSTLVITDEQHPIAIAGVMGGANSEVTEATTSILLESANFKPSSIYYTGRQLILSSEASMRFERGIRPELTIPALKHATQLILQIAGGQASWGIADLYPGKRKRKLIPLSADEVNRLLDVNLSLDQIAGTLNSLGFNCQETGSTSEIRVTAPYWRSDIKLTVDLIEEVARVIGYDKIPVTMLSQPLPRYIPEPIYNLKRKVKNSLVGYGFQEIITYSLTSFDKLNRLMLKPHPLKPMPLRLVNPMTASQEYLRPSLRDKLLSVFSDNRKHEDGGIRLFEVGKVFLPIPKGLPAEPEVLCAVLGGTRLEKSWSGASEPLDFFDARGLAKSLLHCIGIDANFELGKDESLCPSRQVAIIIDNVPLGILGEFHPKVLDAFEITEPVFLFEINITSLSGSTTAHKLYRPVSRYPDTVRDMALVVNTGVNHQSIADIIDSFSLVSQVDLFDVYSGEQVPPGKKSLAYRVVYRSPTHTLTDEEVNKIQEKIISKLSKELGAVLRC